MRWSDFPKWGHWLADWAASYHNGLRDRPVRAQVQPGETLAALPATPPEAPQPIAQVIEDFERIVMPGITHWQHPRFFAYFPSNASPAAVLADQLATVMAPQCMLWQTSPAATEMETRMMEWLRHAVGLPETFAGVIQDSASSATLAAVLTMRERALNWQGNAAGLSGQPRLRIYCSPEAHSSIDRAIWVAGIGQENLVRVPLAPGPMRAMCPAALTAAIKADLAAGHRPAGVIGFEGDAGKGSGRSVSGVDLGAAIQRLAAEGLIAKGGGHRMAAGLSLTRAQLEPAMARLSALLDKQGAGARGAADLRLDGVLMPAACSVELIEQLEDAGPFGAAAPAPRFALPGLRIRYSKPVGQGHLKLTLSDGATTIDAICFDAAGNGIEAALADHGGRALHAAGRLEVNHWNGRQSVQLRLEDAAWAE